MKKFMFICILCGVLLTGCASKTEVATMRETQIITAPVTTFTTAETVEATETTSTATTIVTTIPDETTISAKEEVKTENGNPKVTATTQNATTTAPVTKTTTVTEAPKSKTTTTTTTTVVPILTKRLDATFKAELVEYIQDYCNSSGLIYRDDGNTPENSSWDIPVRTTYCDSNEDIKSAVLTGARMVLTGYGQGTVINLYFEDDSLASGEWRIYVLV